MVVGAPVKETEGSQATIGEQRICGVFEVKGMCY